MRLAAALIASVTLHLAVIAIPGRVPLMQAPSTSTTEPLRVALPYGARSSVAPVAAVPAPPPEVQSNARLPEPQAEEPDAASWFGIPLPRYYEPKELTERAKPLADITVDTPAIDTYPEAGKIVLLLYINEDGKVDDVEVLSSDISSSTVETTIVEQFQLARFTAGKLNGQPVKSKKKIEVVIKPPLVIKPGALPPSSSPARGN
jgi:hypothetical protein